MRINNILTTLFLTVSEGIIQSTSEQYSSESMGHMSGENANTTTKKRVVAYSIVLATAMK
jgi:hypothetical protein